MPTSETKPSPLPRELVLANVSIGDALTALADRLTDLASQMTTVRDLSCDLDVHGDRASLQFRATK
ncbi:hypothetical protein [Rhizobium sp. LjRoot254]|uniref:hypothetical protein n=1 Tax=Rhizobium sp. LjRoot254 TaxID=3342297 RepID=UPI003ED12B2F